MDVAFVNISVLLFPMLLSLCVMAVNVMFAVFRRTCLVAFRGLCLLSEALLSPSSLGNSENDGANSHECR